MVYTTRAEWGARHGRGPITPAPQSGVVIHHDALRHTTAATTVEQERQIMRVIEQHAATTLTPTNPRISYQWAVAGYSGRIYEGLGWNRIGAHVLNANTENCGIFLMLDGRNHAGSDACWRSVSEIVREGIRRGALIARPAWGGHRDWLPGYECPGNTLYQRVRSYTIDSLIALTAPAAPASMVGRRVWSNYFGAWLVVTRYTNDRDWSFVRADQLSQLPATRASTPLSQMPEMP